VVWVLQPLVPHQLVTRDWAPHLKRGTRRRSAFLFGVLVGNRSTRPAFALREEYEWNKQVLEAAFLEPLAVLQEPRCVEEEEEPQHDNHRATTTIYTDDPQLAQYIAASQKYKLSPQAAPQAAVYTTKNVTDFSAIATSVNQFPRESCLVCKDLLVQLARIVDDELLLPLSFDCSTELHHFLKEFTKREAQNEFNTWIVKPARQTRGMGHVICSSLEFALVACSRWDGDCVVQLYVANPLLYELKFKFDMRTLVLVDSFLPLKAWVNFHATFARVAKHQFSVHNLNDKRAHFTVSRYDGDNDSRAPILSRTELSTRFPWTNQIEPQLATMLRALFLAAAKVIGSHPTYCRGAVYGVDWIVTTRPVLLEVNYCPDLTMSMKMDPQVGEGICRVLSGGSDGWDSTTWVRL
jgi:hypothetical protein